ncbi:hypothetical protein SLEP1_g11054 [Rubroshorea leprosula]|uniref:Peptidase C14 caspase domain-containing protein n=1 Tax=Rubroshorea leprosula TaxID=152421 RepID=A0AAV5IK35_9ROSI|nr:hypothetical protein SLEP1_g11054 [Rubroshorea leprosula]
MGNSSSQQPTDLSHFSTSTSSSSTSTSTSTISSQRGRKKALLCGITYHNTKYKLKGTVNDAKNIRKFLINYFNFLPENILMLTEEAEEPDLIPTKCNIERCLSWLVHDCQDGDSLVFFYSGHGLRQPDFDSDELDGFDETICPVDFEKEGMIVDNYINATIVRPLKEGVILHAIIDACHSGTVLDLEYIYTREFERWDSNKPPSGVYKGTSGGLAICISACEDDQMASDTNAFESKMNGALTYLLIEVVRNSEFIITYGKLINEIFRRIEEVNQQGCCNTVKILRKLCMCNITQKPLLSSSEVFDVFAKTFTL